MFTTLLAKMSGRPNDDLCATSATVVAPLCQGEQNSCCAADRVLRRRSEAVAVRPGSGFPDLNLALADFGWSDSTVDYRCTFAHRFRRATTPAMTFEDLRCSTN